MKEARSSSGLESFGALGRLMRKQWWLTLGREGWRGEEEKGENQSGGDWGPPSAPLPPCTHKSTLLPHLGSLRHPPTYVFKQTQTSKNRGNNINCPLPLNCERFRILKIKTSWPGEKSIFNKTIVWKPSYTGKIKLLFRISSEFKSWVHHLFLQWSWVA